MSSKINPEERKKNHWNVDTGDDIDYDVDDHHEDEGDDCDNENCDVPNDDNNGWWPMMNSDADGCGCVAGSVDDNHDSGGYGEDDNIDEKRIS